MAKSKISKDAQIAKLTTELRFYKRNKLSENLTHAFIILVRYAAYCFIAYMVFCCVGELAGKTTDAKILTTVGLNINADTNVTLELKNATPFIKSVLNLAIYIVGLAILGIVSAISYGRRQSKLREQTISRLEGRIKSQELLLDAKRSSSRLPSNGDTPEGEDPLR